MNLCELSLSDYLSELSSSSPAPGGGSASAVCGAQGAALVSMVARLTLGKPKYAEHEAQNSAALERCDLLQGKLAQQAEADTQAFNLVFAAYSLPRETEQQKEARKAAIADASLAATEEPLRTMRLALEALESARALVGHSNTNAASDLGVAALQLLACIKGAWLNVLINLSSLAHAETAAEFNRQGREIVALAESTAQEIYAGVESSLS